MKKAKEKKPSLGIQIRNGILLFAIFLIIIIVYFLFTGRPYMIHYISFFTGLLYFSQFPLSYFLHKKKNKFSCIKCGKCCNMVFKLNKSDIERLEKGNINWRKFINKDWRIKKIDGYCSLLKNKNKESICSVNKYKPDTCKKWPFFSNRFSISWIWIIICPSLRKLIFE
jgi:hypothetical protein